MKRFIPSSYPIQSLYTSANQLEEDEEKISEENILNLQSFMISAMTVKMYPELFL